VNLAIIIACFNRRETTLRCLTHLRSIGVMHSSRVVLVEDGCSDGTPEAVRAQFPEVTLLYGTGELYWGGGTEMGMRWAYEEGSDLFLWLNDDCLPPEGAIEQLVKHVEQTGHAATAWIVADSGLTVGPGYKSLWGIRHSQAVSPDIVSCDTASGNCVCWPRAVVREIGFPDGVRMRHGWVDYDYGLRATRAGFCIDAIPSASCRNSDNPYTVRSPLLGQYTWRELVSCLFKITHPYYLKSFTLFAFKNWRVWGVCVWLLFYGKLLLGYLISRWVPQHYIRRWAEGRLPSAKLLQFHLSRGKSC
jgi:GT2 family glycosyltransferase